MTREHETEAENREPAVARVAAQRGARDQEQEDRREHQPQHDHAERSDLGEQQHRERRTDLLAREAATTSRIAGVVPARDVTSRRITRAVRRRSQRPRSASWYCWAVQGKPASGAARLRPWPAPWRRSPPVPGRGCSAKEAPAAGVVQHDGDRETACRVGERRSRVAGHRAELADERSGDWIAPPPVRVPGRARSVAGSGRGEPVRPVGERARRRRAPARSARDRGCSMTTPESVKPVLADSWVMSAGSAQFMTPAASRSEWWPFEHRRCRSTERPKLLQGARWR